MPLSVPSYLFDRKSFFVPSPPQIYLQINIARFIKALEMRGMGVDRGSAKRSRWASRICVSFSLYIDLSYMYPDAFAIFSIRDHCSNLHRRIQGKLRSQLVSAYCPFLVRLQCHACFYLGVGDCGPQRSVSKTICHLQIVGISLSSSTIPSSQSLLGRAIPSDTSLPLFHHALHPFFNIEPGVAG
jgi:hypothetical protein